MISVAEAGLALQGPMTQVSASALLAEGLAALASGTTLFDLAGVTEADSTALALIFAWTKAARAAGGGIQLANPPAGLLSLAELYGVTDLLPLRP